MIGVIGDREELTALPLEAMPGVERVVAILKPYKLVSREFQPHDTVVDVRGVKVGGGHFAIIAGPCSVETPEQVMEAARAVKAAGGRMLRGGAFKPRTSPYAFQGLGEEGLKMLAAARDETGLPIVTEIMDPRDLDVVCRYADVLQIGARNMQNFLLLAEVGRPDKPVLLKRGLSATIEEWLMAAEYVIKEGNRDVILCERGIRTFETATRNTLDLSAVAVAKLASHLPVIVDPSHATGRPDLVLPLSLAGVAVGADGLDRRDAPQPRARPLRRPAVPAHGRVRRVRRAGSSNWRAGWARASSDGDGWRQPQGRDARGRRRRPHGRLARARRAPRRRARGPRRESQSARRSTSRSSAAPSPPPARALEEAAAGADLVFVATPVRLVVEHVRAALARRGPRRDRDRRGQHQGAAHAQLCRPPSSGAASAVTRSAAPRRPVSPTRAPSLYEGATYFLTPGAHVDPKAYGRLYDFLGEIGARPVAVDPDEHDRLMAARQPPAARARQRAHDAGRRARRRARRRCSARARASAT